MKLAEFESGRDNRGKVRRVEIHEENGKIVQKIFTGNKLNTEVVWSRSQWNDLFNSMFDVQRQLVENNVQEKIIDPSSVDLDTGVKANLLNDVAGSMSREDVAQMFNYVRQEEFEQNITLVVERVGARPYKYRNVEKTKEEVLQLLYEEFGEDWFTSREFKKLYNENYSENRYFVWVQEMKGNELVREKIKDDDPWDDGRIKYKYKISDNVLDLIYRYGSLTSDESPMWQKKKWMKKKVSA